MHCVFTASLVASLCVAPPSTGPRAEPSGVALRREHVTPVDHPFAPVATPGILRNTIVQWTVGGAVVGAVMCAANSDLDCASAIIGMAGTGAVVGGVIALVRVVRQR
jgi:hypothetical protein